MAEAALGSELDTRKNLSDRGIVDDGQACST
jgi:hypothetical protein